MLPFIAAAIIGGAIGSMMQKSINADSREEVTLVQDNIENEISDNTRENDKGLQKKRKKAQIMQENLSSIRAIVGWTAQDLGILLDLSKQAISNIETGKSKLTVAQYIAILSLIKEKSFINSLNSDESVMLSLIIEILFGDDLKVNNDKLTHIIKLIKQYSMAKKVGMDDNILDILCEKICQESTGKSYLELKNYTEQILKNTNKILNI